VQQPQQQHTVTSRTSDLNPFANDNFGSLSAEDIVAQQLDQLHTSGKYPSTFHTLRFSVNCFLAR